MVRSTIHRLGLSPLRFGALDDLNVDLPDDFAKRRLRDRPLIAAVGIELQQEWMQANSLAIVGTPPSRSWMECTRAWSSKP
jgi:hypothetical protein